MPQIYKLEEAAKQCEMDVSVVAQWIENEWILPANPADQSFDKEDIARIRLIRSLRSHLGVNDESVPIILNLLDQLYHLRNLMERDVRGERRG